MEKSKTFISEFVRAWIHVFNTDQPLEDNPDVKVGAFSYKMSSIVGVFNVAATILGVAIALLIMWKLEHPVKPEITFKPNTLVYILVNNVHSDHYYHVRACKEVDIVEDYSPVSIQTAKQQGFIPCKECLAPEYIGH